MSLTANAIGDIINYQFKFALLLTIACLPVLAVGDRRGALFIIILMVVALLLIWIGDGLGEPAAGNLLTAPIYKSILGGILLLIGWSILLRVAATAIAGLVLWVG